MQMLSDLKVQLPDSHVGDAWEDDRCGLVVGGWSIGQKTSTVCLSNFEVLPTVSRSDGHLWTSGSYSHAEYSMAQISHGNLCFPAGYCSWDVSKLRVRPELPWFTPFIGAPRRQDGAAPVQHSVLLGCQERGCWVHFGGLY